MASLFPALLLCAASVHPDTINDIARVESGFNPYAVAEIIPERERGSYGKSVISHMPKSKEEALTVIREIENRKRRYSVGLMQITSSNFSFYSTSAEKLLDSCENLSVFEKIIVDCYKRGRSSRMRLVVTIQEILVTVSEKKKNLIIQVMLSELVIQGTKKNMLYQVQEATGRTAKKSFTQCVSYLARNHSEICFC